jgi:hypothetical protein
VLYFGYKLWNKSKMIGYTEMDFVTGSSVAIPDDVSDARTFALQVLLLIAAGLGIAQEHLEKDL